MIRSVLRKRKGGFPFGGRSRVWFALVQKKGKAVFPSGDVREGGSLCSLRWKAPCPRSQSPFGKNRLPYTLALSLCQTVALYASLDVKPPREKPPTIYHSLFAIRYFYHLLFAICHSLFAVHKEEG
ncbi:MAG: hypothetical protein DRI36_06440 [Caldiserica bacterium]|nr:MAG: hypothetical protein DRI36_06440 [Caldisericota bacterium]